MKAMQVLRNVFRISILCLVVFSICISYYVYIIKKDYLIVTLPDGPDTSDYFSEE